MDGSLVELRGFLYSSGVDTIEIVYRVADRLLAVAIADVEPLAMSAVYCFFDPEQERRSPGVFNVLWMLEECRRRGLPHLYLGFFVRDSPKMSYKAGFGPCELLGADGRWAPYDPSLA
jgi:arginine-tRNA-protein transferase